TTEELITVIGNLLENAYEALEKQTGERSVALYINDEKKEIPMSSLKLPHFVNITERQETNFLTPNFARTV
ncbi:hypothetical protein ACQUW0_27555, partial [Ralstonia pseudosolanacearum]|uniref:hypothetical protein n=1 Tax=Ralstonia pseudosolanacearum TaxID=1310165 RepID=UPI003D164DF1